MGRVVPLLFTLSLGCQVRTQAVVHVDADPVVRDRTRYLCVRTWAGHEEARTDFREEFAAIPEAIAGLPTYVPVHPGRGAPDQTFTFEAAACDGPGCEGCFVDAHFGGSFDSGRVRSYFLTLDEACIGVGCPQGQSCNEGVCVDSRLDEGETELPLPSDDQPAFCRGALCQEHPRPGTHLYAMCASDEDAFVGTSGGVFRREGRAWLFEPLPARDDVESVGCLGGGRAVAGDARGRLFERDPGGVWTEVMGVGAGRARVVAGGAEAWATVGEALLRREGEGAWAPAPAPPGSGAASLALSPDGAELWAWRASPPALFQWDGASWAVVTAPPEADELGRATYADTFVVTSVELDGMGRAVAERFHRWVGGAWETEFFGCPSGFVSMSGVATGEVLGGAGRGRLIYRSAAGEWSCPTALEGAWLGGAALRRGGDEPLGWVATTEGTIQAWDGTRIVPEGALLFRGALTDVAATGPGRFLAVGERSRTHGGGPILLERVGETQWRQRGLTGEGGLVALAVDGARAVAVGERGFVQTRELDGPLPWARTALEAPTTRLTRVVARSGLWLAAGDDERGADTFEPRLLQRADDGRWLPFRPAPPAGVFIGALALGEGDEVWIGGATRLGDGECTGYAIHRHRGGAWERVAEAPCEVTDLHVRSDGAVWVAAQGLQLLREGRLEPGGVLDGEPVERVWLDGDAVRAARLSGGRFRVLPPAGDPIPFASSDGVRAFALDEEGAFGIALGGLRIERVRLE